MDTNGNYDLSDLRAAVGNGSQYLLNQLGRYVQWAGTGAPTASTDVVLQH